MTIQHTPSATMNNTATMNNATTMTTTHRAPEVSSYWKSVKLCLARPDGSVEIHHHDGRVVRIAADGRPQHQPEAARDAA